MIENIQIDDDDAVSLKNLSWFWQLPRLIARSNAHTTFLILSCLS